MIFQCAKCKTRLDLSAVPRDGRRMAVKCTQCGHVEHNVEFSPEGPRSTDELFSAGWQVRRVGGEVLTVGGLPMLRTWIAQGDLLPEDEISDDGETWKPVSTFLGDAALGLHHQAPVGRKPPPLPTEMGFPRQDVPENTIDAPDPEEEFSEHSGSLDDQETLNYTPPPRPVSEPLPSALPIEMSSRSGGETGATPPAFQPEAVMTSDRSFPVSFAPPRRIVENDTIPHETLTELEDRPTEPHVLGQHPASPTDEPTSMPIADDALREAVDYLTTSESRALRFSDKPVSPQDDIRPARPAERGKPSTGPIIAAVIGTAVIVGAGAWLLQGQNHQVQTRVDSPTQTRLSPSDALTITRLLSDADRLMAKDSDSARDRAEQLYGQVLERIGTAAHAPALTAAAQLGRARIALTRAEFAQLSGRKASMELATAATSIERAKAALNPQHPLWLEADLARLKGQIPVVLDAVAQARKNNQMDAFWTFVEATASLHTSDTSGVLEALNTVQAQVQDVPRFDFIRAHVLVRQGKLDEAKKILTARSDSMTDHAAFRALRARLSGVSADVSVNAPPTPSRSGAAKFQRKDKGKPMAGGTEPDRASTLNADGKKAANPEKNHRRSKQKKIGNRATKSPAASGSFKRLMADGSRLLERGRVSAAKTKFESAAKLRPKAPEPHANLGWCAIETKAYANAIRSFKKSLILQPRFSDGLFGLGYAYEKKGRSKDAAAAYRRYLQHYPRGKENRMVRHRLQQLKP
ncbi:MAG: tetratricopeptide repeat protein [Myxococcota bacterium]|nr:tetratricopeptide repeat protein [Myxococcota bacterium]